MLEERIPQNILHSESDGSPVQDDSSSNGENNQMNSSADSIDASSDAYTFIHLLTDEDFSETAFKDVVVDNDVLRSLRATRISPEIRRRLRNFGNSAFAEEIIFLANEKCRENPCTQILPLPSLKTSFPNTSRFGLFATRKIQRGEFVLAPAPVLLVSPTECGRGRMGISLPNIILFSGLQSDFSYFEVVDAEEPSRKRRRDSYSYLQRRKHSVLRAAKEPVYQPPRNYYSDEEESEKTVYDKYDMCIDVSSIEELKAIRRNCVPNCTFRYVLLHQRMEVFLTAVREIQAGEELTLPHDYDSHLSPKVIQCTHQYQPDALCLYEKERQETIRKYAQIAEEQQRSSRSVEPPSTSK